LGIRSVVVIYCMRRGAGGTLLLTEWRVFRCFDPEDYFVADVSLATPALSDSPVPALWWIRKKETLEETRFCSAPRPISAFQVRAGSHAAPQGRNHAGADLLEAVGTKQQFSFEQTLRRSCGIHSEVLQNENKSFGCPRMLRASLTRDLPGLHRDFLAGSVVSSVCVRLGFGVVKLRVQAGCSCCRSNMGPGGVIWSGGDFLGRESVYLFRSIGSTLARIYRGACDSFLVYILDGPFVCCLWEIIFDNF